MISYRAFDHGVVIYFHGGLQLEVWDLSRPLAAWSLVGATSVWFAKWGRA